MTNRICEKYMLHVATTVENASVDTFLSCASTSPFPSPASNCWHYVTGADAVDVGALTMNRYFEGGSHGPFDTPPRDLSLAFDERAVMVAASNPVECAQPAEPVSPDPGGGCIVILEREFDDPFGAPTSYHQGGVPAPTDTTMVRLDDLPYPDNGARPLAVQEPYDHEKVAPEFQNMTLFISTDGARYLGSVVPIRNLRLRGLFWDEANTRWTMRQALKVDDPTGGPGGTPTYELKDMPLDSSLELSAIFGSGAFFPTTPGDSEVWVDDEAFTAAVLADDWQGNPRVFAVNASHEFPNTNRWVVQWYIIDPDLANFHSAPLESDTWTPTIVEAGRITGEGDCYLPTIGVSRCGQAFIEYTFSSDTIYPQIRRAVLNLAGDTVLSDTLVQTGPSSTYATPQDRWALHPDMQANPNGGGFWSAHTLVENAATRDVWLMKSSYNCFQTDMNLDGFTDTYDMMMYTDYYTAGDERADTDADGRVDVIDMLNFIDAYDAATGQ